MTSPYDPRDHPTRQQSVDDRPAHGATGSIVLTLNVVSAIIAVIWFITGWVGFIKNRGYWSFWPLFWLAGTGILLLAQFFASVLPSCAIAWRLPKSFGRLLIVTSFLAFGITLGGVAAIFIYDAIVPQPHHIGP